jgi:poly-gamma-glutamate synthesis protein (capsule biosynthesis protein)
MICRRMVIHEGGPPGAVIDLIRRADVAFTNLEVVPNDFRGYATTEGGGSHLGASSWVIDELVAMGFDLFAAATNHSLDYGIEGLLATIDALERRGVAFAGIGRTLTDARMPVYLDHPSGTVALISCASTFASGQQAADNTPGMPGRPGLNPLRYDQVFDVTPDQLAVLREIATNLGLELRREELLALGFGFPPDDPELYPFLNATFRSAAVPAIHSSPRQRDLDAIAAWVREARVRADTVIVSLHASEQGARKDQPAAFIQAFARRMIDDGADVVVGHGPHLLRGVEVYRGKPIFYSLGNFIAQNELTAKLPADSYDHFRVDYDKPPGEVYRVRSDDGRKGFPAQRRIWESAVPVCVFEDGHIVAIEIVPIGLGYGRPIHRRGRPAVAEGSEAAAILERLRALSSEFGTRLVIRGDCATVHLPGGRASHMPKSSGGQRFASGDQ